VEEKGEGKGKEGRGSSGGEEKERAAKGEGRGGQQRREGGVAMKDRGGGGRIWWQGRWAKIVRGIRERGDHGCEEG